MPRRTILPPLEPTVVRDEERTIVGVPIARELTLGSARRGEELRARFAPVLRRAGGTLLTVELSTVRARFDAVSEDDLLALLTRLRKMLMAAQHEPLHPRIVEEILGITAQERIRWTKQGRFRRSGSGSFDSGWQIVTFPMYSAAAIAALVANPEEIAAWRNETA